MAAAREGRRGRGRFGGHGQQLRQRVFAEDLVDALGGAADRRRGDEGVGGGEQLEVLLRMGQRIVRDQRGHVGQFGGFGAEKFAPGRGVEEEIGDGDRGSARQGGVFHVVDFAAGNFEVRAGSVFAGGGFERDARDGGDGGQRLAAKAERGNGEQIVGGAQLRSGVALEGQQRVVAIHALAVVGDADELAAAGLDFDANAVGAGVERVFQQLLDDGGGPVDHFAGGDLVGHLVGKNADAPHAKRLSGRRAGIRENRD